MKNYLKISLLINVVIYLLISFIMWDITFITCLPEYDKTTRLVIVIFYACKEGLVLTYYNNLK